MEGTRLNYSNIFFVTPSGYDVTIQFSIVAPYFDQPSIDSVSSHDQNNIVVNHSIIQLSWPVTKLLVQALQGALSEYEALHGKIPDVGSLSNATIIDRSAEKEGEAD